MTTPLIAINQYGDKVILDGKAPRKELAEKYGVASSSLFKIYRDTKDGDSKHVGYGLLGLWFDLYQLTEWHHTAKACDINDDGYCAVHEIQGQYTTLPTGKRVCENALIEAGLLA